MECTNCNKEIKKAKGSLGFPYCKKCFKKIWKNDYMAYYNWLRKAYMVLPKKYEKKEKATQRK